jgi:hypothetical protein
MVAVLQSDNFLFLGAALVAEMLHRNFQRNFNGC